jgi:hypothetical protein
MLALRSIGDVLGTLERARHVKVQAYTLHGPVLHAVEAAARRGADVSVELEGRPLDSSGGHLAAENRRLARELRAAGAAVTLGHPLHAKAITADGTLYLDEKNWAKSDLVLREDDPVAVKAIPTDKRDALALEAALLGNAHRGDDAIVESESFGSSNVVEAALARLARSGAVPRLLVAQRELRSDPCERAVLERLVGDGVRVAICADSAKLAVAGGRAWLGSANATSPYGRGAMTDWGVDTSDDAIVHAVRDRLEKQWAAARPFKISAARERFGRAPKLNAE